MNPAPSQYSMYHVYLLKSRKSNSLYNGYTTGLKKIEPRTFKVFNRKKVRDEQKEGAG
jgi:hypothetical protein